MIDLARYIPRTATGWRLTVRELAVMFALHRQPATLSVLMERTGLLHVGNASELVSRMVKAGWLRRQQSHVDHRSPVIHLTAKGIRVVHATPVMSDATKPADP